IYGSIHSDVEPGSSNECTSLGGTRRCGAVRFCNWNVRKEISSRENLSLLPSKSAWSAGDAFGRRREKRRNRARCLSVFSGRAPGVKGAFFLFIGPVERCENQCS